MSGARLALTAPHQLARTGGACPVDRLRLGGGWGGPGVERV
jgi:hypothetical protein